jgi:hypothetical protein
VIPSVAPFTSSILGEKPHAYAACMKFGKKSYTSRDEKACEKREESKKTKVVKAWSESTAYGYRVRTYYVELLLL